MASMERMAASAVVVRTTGTTPISRIEERIDFELIALILSTRSAQNREMPLFSPQSLKFLRDLKKHNDREWFQPRKATYDEHVKAPMLAFIEIINSELAKIAPEFVTEPKKALFRIYRDTRFANDKTPYKTNTSALFW